MSPKCYNSSRTVVDYSPASWGASGSSRGSSRGSSLGSAPGCARGCVRGFWRLAVALVERLSSPTAPVTRAGSPPRRESPATHLAGWRETRGAGRKAKPGQWLRRQSLPPRPRIGGGRLRQTPRNHSRTPRRNGAGFQKRRGGRATWLQGNLPAPSGFTAGSVSRGVASQRTSFFSCAEAE